jgi:hypothetical protein
MKKLTIPRLYCPFVSMLNSHVETLKQNTDQWVSDFELYSQEEIGNYFESNYSYFTSRFYPKADYDRLRIANDLIILLFMMDDQIDSPAMNSHLDKESELKQFIARVLEIISQKSPSDKEDEIPIFKALKDVWSRLAAISSDEWLSSFAKEIEYVFTAAVWERQNSANKKLPEIQAYLERRRYMGAANITLALIEPVEKIYLPEFIKQNSEFQELGKVACNAICIANDLFSLRKEQMLGDEHNLPSIIKNELGFTWEEAILHTAEIHDTEVQKFIAVSKQLPSFDKQTDETLHRYIEILELQMAGNLIWSESETQRYQFAYDTTGNIRV